MEKDIYYQIKPDLEVVDISIPKLNGLDVIAKRRGGKHTGYHIICIF